MPRSFVHLHLHTEFSLLHGVVSTAVLVERAQELGMPAVAMTHAGHLCGAVEFDRACRAGGIKPIFGCEIAVASPPEAGSTGTPSAGPHSRLVLLAKDETGWRNLVRLASGGRLDGLHLGGPPVAREKLARHARGLVCLTGGAAGPVNRALAVGDVAGARRTLEELRGIFGADDTYVELHDHGSKGTRKNLAMLVALARETGLHVLAANDVRFLDRDDHATHEVLGCIGAGARLTDPGRPRSPVEAWYKGPEEMRALFRDLPEACDATLEIAAKCEVRLERRAPDRPAAPPWFDAGGGTPEECLRRCCREGLAKTYGGRRAGDPAVAARLDHELAIIEAFGLAPAFLALAELVRWARAEDIPVGPGYGPLPGSLAAHVTGITEVCPLRSGLNFERFFNPQRPQASLLFGIEVCPERRREVLAHLRQRHGADAVAQVIHFEQRGPRSLVLDVAGAMGLSHHEVEPVASLVDPDYKSDGSRFRVHGRPLAHHLGWNRPLREIIESSPVLGALWSHALKLEGQPLGATVRPDEVLVGHGSLLGDVPLIEGPDGGWVSQFGCHSLEECGRFLLGVRGLRELTVVHEAGCHVARRTGRFDLRAVPLDDPAAFAMVQSGHIQGVFQFDSPGLASVCRDFVPASIEDIGDLIACYRPGGMRILNPIIGTRRGETPPFLPHPLLRPLCAPTGGMPIYQEQIQQAAARLAGLSLAEGDVMRRCTGKRRTEEMDFWRGKFVRGCAAVHGLDEETACRIFDWIAMFSGYAYNKSHAISHARLSYWTAYLKANHPAEFMAAALSRRGQAVGDNALLAIEARRLGLTILPPDVNASAPHFTPEPDASGAPAIRCGLAAIRHAGGERMARVVAERDAHGPFAGLDDFVHRLGTGLANRRVLDLLVRVGAFDRSGETRAAMCGRLEQGDVPRDLPEWPAHRRLADERLLLGFCCGAHPLDACRGVIDSSRHLELGKLEEPDRQPGDQRHEFAGVVWSPRTRTDEDGKPFAIFVLEDFTGSAEVRLGGVVFHRARAAGLLEAGRAIRLAASLRHYDETGAAKLVGHAVGPLQAVDSGAAPPPEL